jgi:preprotein translocase subunit SecF
MFQFFVGTDYDFLARRRIAYAVSLLLILASAVSLIVKGGPRLGIDFTGGTLLQVRFDQAVAVDEIRDALGRMGLEGSEIQEVHGETGREVLMRIPMGKTPEEVLSGVRAEIGAKHPGIQVDLRKQETVGPKVGRELRGKAFWAILWSLVGILIYVGIRYDFRFGAGAVLALFHDVFITLGIFSILDKEFNITVVAALLTIAGYSINDTIVILDRIREQMREMRRESLYRIMNVSVNQTLSRTILTSLTVLMSVLFLYLMGGSVIHDFAFAMLIGVVIGSYSTIFVASALVLELDNWMKKRRKVQKAA